MSGRLIFDHRVTFIDQLITWVRTKRKSTCWHETLFNYALHECFLCWKNPRNKPSYIKSPRCVPPSFNNLNARLGDRPSRREQIISLDGLGCNEQNRTV